MNKVKYVKYSYNRDFKYQTRTIIKIEDGKTRVYKNSLSEVGNEHINNIKNYHDDLVACYKKSKITVSNCELMDKSTISFEYILGESLETQLDEYLNSGKIKEMIELMNDYFLQLAYSENVCEFSSNDEYEKIFGSIIFDKETKCLRFTNIDAIFGNVKLKNDRFTFIDYEWCIEATVPVNYIIYRCIFWYANAQIRATQLLDVNFYKIFNITDNEIKLYSSMENAFQLYVMGEYIPEWKIKNNIITETHLLEEHSQLKKTLINQVQIYEDYGGGFKEENSYFIDQLNTLDNRNYFKSMLVVNKNTVKVRIDPSIHRCLFILESLSYTDKIIQPIVFEHNGATLSNSIILFMEEDPQIVFDVKNKKKIDFSGWIIPLQTSVMEEFSEHIKSIDFERVNADNAFRELHSVIDGLTNSLKDYQVNVAGLQGHIYNLESQIPELRDSTNKLESEKEALREHVNILENKLLRIVKSRIFKLIGWYFNSDEINIK